MHSAPLDVSNISAQRNRLSPENSTESHWSLVQRKCSLAHARRWHLCLVVWSGTLAGRLTRRPRWCKRYWMVWRDTWVPLTPHLNVPGVEWHSSSGYAGCGSKWSGYQCGMWPKDVHFYAFLWLFQSLLQPADDTLWRSTLSGHIRLRTSCLKPRSGEVLVISCKVLSWSHDVKMWTAWWGQFKYQF